MIFILEYFLEGDQRFTDEFTAAGNKGDIFRLYVWWFVPHGVVTLTCMRCVTGILTSLLHPTGTAGRSAKALRECGAPTRWAMVCRVQTCPELAEENRRNLSRGSQKDKEYILGLKEFWTDNRISRSARNSCGCGQLLLKYRHLPQYGTQNWKTVIWCWRKPFYASLVSQAS